MTNRYIPIVAALACLSVAGAPAFATDDPPQPPVPPTDTQPATDDTSPASDTPPAQTAPAACVDKVRPRTRVATKAKTAARTHMLRGTATDAPNCGKAGSVALVSVSIALKHGKHCQFLTRKAKFSRSRACKSPRWISATGTKKWRLKLPRKLRHGSYQILTRAVDSAGNVERAHARRLAIRQTRSTHKKK